jgi:ribosome-associated heat shock protein Hsp15
LAGPGARPDRAAQPRLRLDKWLWQARFFKGRDLAADMITSGHCRINSQPCRKPGHGVQTGDTLTFPQADRIRVIRVIALGYRRGPAPEAQSLYLDLDAPASDLESPAPLL